MPKKPVFISQILLLIFSYCDQQEKLRLQLLCKEAYNNYIPRLMKSFVIERPFVHLYLGNRKRFIIAYLDNYKAVEIPRLLDESMIFKKKKSKRSTSSSSSSSNSSQSSSDEIDENYIKELTDRVGFKIPDHLRKFTSLQYGRLLMVIGGMNTFIENPFDLVDGDQQFDKISDQAFIFNVQARKWVLSSQMMQPRAKHCSCLFTPKGSILHKKALVVGGIGVSYKVDHFHKQKTQSLFNLETVEMFDFKTNKWSMYNSKLAIPRHSASVCEVKGFFYVIGGHTIQEPDVYINSIERSPIDVFSSYFEILNVDYKGLDMRVQNCISMPIYEENGIMVLSQHSVDPNVNQAFFFDAKRNKLQPSRYYNSVGAMNHWHGSHAVYKQYTAFLTEELQVLRFDNRGYDWSVQELAEIKWIFPPEKTSFNMVDDKKKAKKQLKKMEKQKKKQKKDGEFSESETQSPTSHHTGKRLNNSAGRQLNQSPESHATPIRIPSRQRLKTPLKDFELVDQKILSKSNLSAEKQKLQQQRRDVSPIRRQFKFKAAYNQKHSQVSTPLK